MDIRIIRWFQFLEAAIQISGIFCIFYFWSGFLLATVYFFMLGCLDLLMCSLMEKWWERIEEKEYQEELEKIEREYP